MAEEKKVLEASKKAPAKKAPAKKAPAKKAAAPKAEGAKKAPAKKAPAKKVEAAEAPKAKKVVASELNRVEKKYREEIIPELMKEFGYKTPMEAHWQYQSEQTKAELDKQNNIHQQQARNRQSTTGSLAGGAEPSGFEADFLSAFDRRN